ncbi:histone-like nucleoid-structuring protein Lsr2 [Actinomadura rugatobispora]|uniref:Lsr2 family protein n=1 Tax=Actinomadura rugatobispora TaxID=1994 RepID=A0ABW1AJG7_9ACTN|nr:Lsr2 family protein [Actinomadura rugatobispora]
MAEKVILVDDIDGTEDSDVAKRDFDVLGRKFTIDLSDANDKRLRDALDTIEAFVDKAREVKAAGRGRKAASPAKIKGYTNSDVREWARENDVEVSAKGVIADEVYAAFIEAHPDAAPDGRPGSGEASADASGEGPGDDA